MSTSLITGPVILETFFSRVAGKTRALWPSDLPNPRLPPLKTHIPLVNIEESIAVDKFDRETS